MAVITYLPTTLDIPVERVLKSEEALSCDTAIVVGEIDGQPYLATSTSDIAKVNLMLDIAKMQSMESMLCFDNE